MNTTKQEGKHTAGPWYLDSRKDSNDCQMIYADGHIPIAIIHTVNDFDGYLLAAAPELVEALETLVNQLGDIKHFNINFQGYILKAEQALQKASA